MFGAVLGHVSAVWIPEGWGGVGVMEKVNSTVASQARARWPMVLCFCHRYQPHCLCLLTSSPHPLLSLTPTNCTNTIRACETLVSQRSFPSCPVSLTYLKPLSFGCWESHRCPVGICKTHAAFLPIISTNSPCRRSPDVMLRCHGFGTPVSGQCLANMRGPLHVQCSLFLSGAKPANASV